LHYFKRLPRQAPPVLQKNKQNIFFKQKFKWLPRQAPTVLQNSSMDIIIGIYKKNKLVLVFAKK